MGAYSMGWPSFSMGARIVPEGGCALFLNVLEAAIRNQSTPNLARWLGRRCRFFPYHFGKDRTHIWEFVAPVIWVWEGVGKRAGKWLGACMGMGHARGTKIT